MGQNYQIKMEEIITSLGREKGKKPSLLLQCCCGPCSSYVLTCLAEHFDLSVFFYNPNISPPSEYELRENTLGQLLQKSGFEGSVGIIKASYIPEEFFSAVRGLENEPEGGERCIVCIRLRMEACAARARELGMDFFTTTLSVSPHKNSQCINDIGAQLEKKYSVRYLYADFKKKDGYRRSVELSRKYGLYRQDYCGCPFSMRGD